MSVVPVSRVDGQYKDIQAALLGSTNQSTPDPRHENSFASHSHYPQRVQLFSGLSEVEMKTINAAARSLRKERGEFVYMPGDQGRLRLLPEERKNQTVSAVGIRVKRSLSTSFKPGEIFGEFALIDESVRSNMTQALDDVTILVFNKRDFVQSPQKSIESCFELHPNGWRSPPEDGEEALGHYFQRGSGARLRIAARTFGLCTAGRRRYTSLSFRSRIRMWRL